MQLKSHYNCVYKLTFHLVLVTKYRKKCISSAMLADLGMICKNTLEKWSCDLIEFNGEADHVHLLIETNPTVELASLVNNLKTVSSRLIRKKYAEELKKVFWKEAKFWTRAYCLLSTGGANIETIRQYIEKQGKLTAPSKT